MSEKRRRSDSTENKEEIAGNKADQSDHSTTAPKEENGHIPKMEANKVASPSVAAETKDVGDSLIRAMLHTKVERFVNPSNIVFVCFREDKVVDVWKGLVKHNFLSCPVLQKTENRFFGSIDIADIVSHLVKKFGSEELRGTEAFWQRLDAAKAFGDLTINDIMQYPLSRRNPFHPVKEGYSLLFALELLAREQDLHRVPVISSEERKLVNMITQSQVVDFLYKHVGDLGPKSSKTLAECPQFFKNVHSVKESELAIDGFARMIEHDVSGLAIVSEEGRLTGNLSLRDLKSVGYDLSMFWRFYQTVENYVVKLRKEYQEKHGRPKHVVFATKEDTLANVVSHLAENHIHRLYVVDSKKDKKPIGVVSLKDVLLELLNP